MESRGCGNDNLQKYWQCFQSSGNVFKSFHYFRPLHHKYFIVFNAINRFSIGVNGPKKTPLNKISYTTLSSYVAMLLSWLASFISRHFSTGRLKDRALKNQWRGGKGTEREIKVCELQWPCPWISSPAERDPSPLYNTLCIGDSSVWQTVFVLNCYWWHFGVTVSWWSGSPPTSQPAAERPTRQWGPEELGLELRRPQLGATP